jgi:hypothetical protein
MDRRPATQEGLGGMLSILTYLYILLEEDETLPYL